MKHWEDHPEPVEGCFGCKALTLQINTGDANSRRSMPTKAFNAELDAYKAARAHGIQPAGTSMRKIQEAVKLVRYWVNRMTLARWHQQDI
jgi:hypothetical protein